MEGVISLDKIPGDDGPSISLDDGGLKSVDFGIGAEMLMNDKHKKGGSEKPPESAAVDLKKELDDIRILI